MIPTHVTCCGKLHEIIQWSTKAPKPFGAECSVCKRRVSGETEADVLAGFIADTPRDAK